MTDKVTMKALGTLHISNVQADNLMEGDTFEISETEAKQLEDRGLAKRMGAKSEKAAPENKMASASADKTISAVSAPAKPARKR